MSKTVPVYIVAGFLGSGKTTFLKNILKNQSDYKIGVIRNEFTDNQISFEAPLLITGKDNFKNLDVDNFENFQELPNSCVCCMSKTQLSQAVIDLVNKSNVGNTPREIDIILVELSGVTDPLIVSKQLMELPAIIEAEKNEKISIIPIYQGTIILGDSSLLSKTLLNDTKVNLKTLNLGEKDSELFDKILIRQIVAADMYIMNKIDLVQSEKELFSLESYIRCSNPLAIVHRTKFSKIDIEILRNLKATTATSAFDLGAHYTPGSNTSLQNHLCNPLQIENESFEFDPSLKFNIELLVQNLREYIEKVQTEPQSTFFRAKGIMNSDTEIHMVRDVIEIEKLSIPVADKKHRFLLVGKNLDRELFLKYLRKAIQFEN